MWKKKKTHPKNKKSKVSTVGISFVGNIDLNLHSKVFEYA